MYLTATAAAFGREAVTLGTERLRRIPYFEKETSARFYKAAADETPLSLALSASRLALGKSNLAADEINAVIYAGSLLKDYASWSLSAALCRDLGASRAMFLDIYQCCNGALAGIQQAVDLLRARPGFEHVLVAVSLVLPEKLGRHEILDRGAIFSDAGAAVVVSRSPGPFEIHALNIGYSAAQHDYFYLPYGGTEILKTEAGPEWPLVAIKDVHAKADADFFLRLFKSRAALIRDTVSKLALDSFDVRWLMVPNYCREFTQMLRDLFPHLPLESTSIPFATLDSHMGAADVIVSLDRLSGRIGNDEVALVCQDGVGFSYGAMVLRKRAF